MPFVSPEHVERRRTERAAAANPELAAELAELETVSRLYRSTVAAARNALLEAVPEMQNEMSA